MAKDIKYWVTLSTNLAIGAKTLKHLDNSFENMEEVWSASNEKFFNLGINTKIVKIIDEIKRNKNPDDEFKKIERLGIKAITYKDSNYPKLLREIPDCPALLYYKGDVFKEDNLAISVVGSRKYTPYGLRAVEKIVGPLSESGLTIVSGLALGIDSIAHKVALKNGRTVAVLGNGLDRVYPESNRGLANDIVKSGGAVISEFPVGTPSFKQNFPFRNRIIAGLSLGTLVIEAAVKSGSLITASAALEYNREVFAIPGSIFNESSEGPINLIKMGAKCVSSAEDVLGELNIESKIQVHHAKNIIPDTKEEAEILGLIKDKPVHVDKFAESSRLDIVKINQTLVLMEMKGKIKNIGRNQYIIIK